MNIVLFDLTYLSLHFLLFFVLLRRLPTFYREKNIFLYHMVSFAGYFAFQFVLVPFALPFGAWFSYIVFGLSIHGIYSLSFLELWSLTQGSYSLGILDSLRTSPSDFNNGNYQRRLEGIGEQKLAERLEVLKRLKLIRGNDSEPSLTRCGRLLVGVIVALLRLSAGKSFNG